MDLELEPSVGLAVDVETWLQSMLLVSSLSLTLPTAGLLKWWPAGHMRPRTTSQVAQPIAQPEKQKNNTFS